MIETPIPLPAGAPADTLAVAVRSVDSLAAGFAAPVGGTTAADLYGPFSHLDCTAPAGGWLPASTDHPLFQCFVLLLAAAYALFLYDHMSDLYALLGKRTRSERLLESRSGQTRFFATAFILGILLAGAFAVRLFQPAKGGSPFFAVPDSLLHALPAAALLFGVALFQIGVLRGAGRLTLSREVTGALLRLKTLVFTVFISLGAPLMLLFVLTPSGTGGIWPALLCAVGFVLAAVLLRESLMLFLSKKISILHWFLYLCIVEIFPISFLWLIATRSQAS